MTRSVRRTLLALWVLCLLAAAAWSAPAMQSYSDPEESYSISYPSQLFLLDDPAALGRAKESVARQMPKNQFDISRQGIQFYLYSYKPGTVPFNPNCSLIIRPVPGDMTADQYYQGGLEGLKEHQVKILDGPTNVQINGRPFWCVTIQAAQQGALLHCKMYMYYIPTLRLSYSLTMTDSEADYAKHFPDFETAVATFKIK